MKAEQNAPKTLASEWLEILYRQAKQYKVEENKDCAWGQHIGVGFAELYERDGIDQGVYYR